MMSLYGGLQGPVKPETGRAIHRALTMVPALDEGQN